MVMTIHSIHLFIVFKSYSKRDVVFTQLLHKSRYSVVVFLSNFKMITDSNISPIKGQLKGPCKFIQTFHSKVCSL